MWRARRQMFIDSQSALNTLLIVEQHACFEWRDETHLIS
jgi:hypothetical protein